MSREVFRELAELWQEQVDPGEQAKFQMLARKIKDRVRRRLLINFGIASVAVGLILVTFAFPALPFLKAVLALCLFMLVWTAWKGQKIAAAALAMDASDPAAFLNDAIENARAELRFSARGVYVSALVFALWLVLILTGQGVESWDLVPDELFGFRYVKVAVLLVAATLFFAYFMRANRKLSDRLRRLEAMRRECDEENARDLTEA